MKQLVFVCGFVWLLQPALCQENYLSGFVINNNNDTLRGFINYGKWSINPKKISFKEELSGESHTYTPNDIKKFNVASEIYESAIVQIETRSPAEYTRQVILVTDTAFLETIIQGNKKLYYNKPSRSHDHFYIKQDSSFDLLVYKKYKEGNIIKENNQYYGQLVLYLNNCPKLQEQMKHTNYSKQELARLFMFYYENCAQTKTDFTKKYEKITLDWGITSGAMLYKIKFADEEKRFEQSRIDYNTTVGFSIGAFAEWTLPRPQRRFSIRNELAYASNYFKGSYSYFQIPNHAPSYTTVTTMMNLSYLKINNMIRYKFYTQNDFHLFANIGFSWGVLLKKTNSKKTENKYRSYEDKLFSENTLNNNEIGGLFGIGGMLKKYSFEIRYERGTGMSDYVFMSSPTTRIHFLFGFTF